MFSFRTILRRFRRSRSIVIDPSEILLDASNLPSFDKAQMEGKIARPIDKRVFIALGGVVILLVTIATYRIGHLQILEGEAWAAAAETNSLRRTIIFTERGVIEDRTGVPLAWNTIREDDEVPYPLRAYATTSGVAHVLGYVRPPRADQSGVFYQTDYIGIAGAEELYDERLRGENGVKIVETDAMGHPQSESVLSPPAPGESVTLSVDARVSSFLYDSIAATAERVPFQGGAGVVMDIENGEILAMASYPEILPNAIVNGSAREVQELINHPKRPFLDRVIAGLYTPGSIVKPFLALGALQEKLITPSDIIVSEGRITVPNPYDPSKPTIFRDWRAHGPTDMARAIAVSSDVYFYTIGGGYRGRRGLGIGGIEKYLRMFGVGEKSGFLLSGEIAGVIPNPAWKEATFPDDPTWRLGDTYNSSIGQYGMQVTPIEMVRATAALANGGTLLTPTILKGQKTERASLDIPTEHIDVIQRGMRQAVTEGTATALAVPGLTVAGKTGTAEVGVRKEYVNSWIIGFFPYEKPRYAFAVIMERGPTGNPTGAPYVFRQFLDKLLLHTPAYAKGGVSGGSVAE